MFRFEYIILIAIIITEAFCLIKYLRQNRFEKVDIYVTQFLITGTILFILSNIILLLTWNISKDQIYVTSVTRAIYILVYCTSVPFISSYVFNHISISKKIDIISHCILVIANLIPVIMVILIPVYLNGRTSSVFSISELLNSPIAASLEEESFISTYLYLIAYDEHAPYFSTALCLSWFTILLSYIFIIISLIPKKTRIKSQKVEHYYMFLIVLLYICMTLNLLCSPHVAYSLLVYHIRQVLEVSFFLILASIDNQKTCGGTAHEYFK